MILPSLASPKYLSPLCCLFRGPTRLIPINCISCYQISTKLSVVWILDLHRMMIRCRGIVLIGEGLCLVRNRAVVVIPHEIYDDICSVSVGWADVKQLEEPRTDSGSYICHMLVVGILLYCRTCGLWLHRGVWVRPNADASMLS